MNKPSKVPIRLRRPDFQQSTYKIIFKKNNSKRISSKMVKREATVGYLNEINGYNGNFELWEYPNPYSCNLSAQANSSSHSSSLSSIYDDLNWPLSPLLSTTNDLGSVYYSTDDTGSSDEFPWDSRSLADSKDPLMTDAVNCSSPIFSSFSDPPKPTISTVAPQRSEKPQYIFLKAESIKHEPIEIKTEPMSHFSSEFPTLTPNSYTIIHTHNKPDSLPQSTQHIANHIQLSHRYSTYNKPLQHSANQTTHMLTSSANNIPQKTATPSKIVLNTQHHKSQSSAPFENLPFDINSFKIPPFFEENSSPLNSSSSNSSTSSNFSSSSSTTSSSSSSANKKKPRLHLLQFIYCLLNDEKPNQCVCWVDQNNCVFRIINPSKLTHMWGRYKANPNMSFDSLSRSLRLYYATGRLERVAGQRNQYRFINREESINFNRRNKRKQPPNTPSSISSNHSKSLPTSSSSPVSSSHIQSRYNSNTTSINPYFHRTTLSNQPNNPKTSNPSLMFGSKMSPTYHNLTRRLI